MAKPPNIHLGKIDRLEAKLEKLKTEGRRLGEDPKYQEKLRIAYAGLTKEQRRLLRELSSRNEKSTKEIVLRKERMAVTVHDLKVPITVSLLNLEFAGMEADDTEKANYLIAVRRELEFLLDTISNLLALEQGDATHVSFQEIDLRELIEEIIERMAVIITDKRGLTLENKIDPHIPSIKADRHILTRIFNNLFSNAIKYTEEGSISVSATHDSKAETVKISVADTGHGIEPERLPQLFNMFQGDSDRHDSSGVGLAFVKHAAELHGGTAVISSEKGSGTTVCVVLPVFGGRGKIGKCKET